MLDICYILLRGAAEYLQCYIKAVHRLVIITHSFQTAQVAVWFIMLSQFSAPPARDITSLFRHNINEVFV